MGDTCFYQEKIAPISQEKQQTCEYKLNNSVDSEGHSRLLYVMRSLGKYTKINNIVNKLANEWPSLGNPTYSR